MKVDLSVGTAYFSLSSTVHLSLAATNEVCFFHIGLHWNDIVKSRNSLVEGKQLRANS